MGGLKDISLHDFNVRLPDPGGPPEAIMLLDLYNPSQMLAYVPLQLHNIYKLIYLHLQS